mmetsp:Transcript_6362/g.10607  ORF Transcript_6362/g.10607 Transcript_6362/m.10607 type:complete len:233 (-) Transcript_6362:462-1160(-)
MELCLCSVWGDVERTEPEGEGARLHLWQSAGYIIRRSSHARSAPSLRWRGVCVRICTRGERAGLRRWPSLGRSSKRRGRIRPNPSGLCGAVQAFLPTAAIGWRECTAAELSRSGARALPAGQDSVGLDRLRLRFERRALVAGAAVGAVSHLHRLRVGLEIGVDDDRNLELRCDCLHGLHHVLSQPLAARLWHELHLEDEQRWRVALDAQLEHEETERAAVVDDPVRLVLRLD